jgi:flagellar basal-body rod modification protein FlgD
MATTSAVSSSSGTSSTTSTDKFASLSSTQFMNIMLSELKNQDPLQPQDTTKMLDQLSSLRNIESQTSLQDSLKSLVSQNQISSAGAMIGKSVEGLDASNNSISGLVTSVRVVDNKAMLELDNGKSLEMGRVTSISTSTTN